MFDLFVRLSHRTFCTVYRAVSSVLLWRTLTTLVIVAAGSAIQIAAAELPGPIEKALRKLGLPQESLSVFVAMPGKDNPILSFNADVSRNPASAMKLVTSYAALDLLTPGFRWNTRFYAEKPVSGGVLDGDLYIQGGGDPLILVEDFLRILLDLKLRGLEEIRGDLVIDNSYFDNTGIRKHTLDGKTHRVYNTPPSATVINFNATRFILIPTSDSVRIVADPPASTLKIVNQIQLISGSCQGRYKNLDLSVSNSGRATQVKFTGKYPKSCSQRSITRRVLDYERYILGVFDQLWMDLGGTLRGGLRLDKTPAQANLILTHESRPLFDVLRGINKYSNNQMARMLLLTLGTEVQAIPGTPEAGRLAIQGWLKDRGLNLTKLSLDNGAGLSREARISARGLGNLLLDLLDHPHSAELLASLSLAGIDGSMKKRHKNKNGEMRIKTGLLNGVRAAAGVVHTENNRNIVVVILQNHRELNYQNGNDVQDSITNWIIERY